jgi:hypothetical protein
MVNVSWRLEEYRFGVGEPTLLDLPFRRTEADL